MNNSDLTSSHFKQFLANPQCYHQVQKGDMQRESIYLFLSRNLRDENKFDFINQFQNMDDHPFIYYQNILNLNRRNINLYNADFGHFLISKLNLNSEEFIPKKKNSL
jgi:hypothetical protein